MTKNHQSWKNQKNEKFKSIEIFIEKGRKIKFSKVIISFTET